MKLYTLEYDCNSPVVQQINVPTNTDYKVGVKFVKDGNIQALTPNSVTLGTLSADSDKTNGYVTFTLSADDNASYKQCDVRVDKLMDVIDGSDLSSLSVTIVKRSNKVNPSVPANVLSTMVGKTLYCKNVYIQYSMDNETWYDIDYVAAYNQPLAFWVFDAEGNTLYQWETLDRKWGKNVGGQYVDFVDSIVIEDGWYFYSNGTQGNNFPRLCPNWTGPSTPTADVPLYTRIIYKFGDSEIHQTFTLNTNIYKSQQGDICEIGNRANTVSIAGTLSDSTPFDYNVVIK